MQGPGNQDSKGRIPLCHPVHHPGAYELGVQALVSFEATIYLLLQLLQGLRHTQAD
jgi:hypothetical protein